MKHLPRGRHRPCMLDRERQPLCFCITRLSKAFPRLNVVVCNRHRLSNASVNVNTNMLERNLLRKQCVLTYVYLCRSAEVLGIFIVLQWSWCFETTYADRWTFRSQTANVVTAITPKNTFLLNSLGHKEFVMSFRESTSSRRVNARSVHSLL